MDPIVCQHYRRQSTRSQHPRRDSETTGVRSDHTVILTTIDTARWQVELFFKWIKHTLRIKAFFGASENAVRRAKVAEATKSLWSKMNTKPSVRICLYSSLEDGSATLSHSRVLPVLEPTAPGGSLRGMMEAEFREPQRSEEVAHSRL